MPPVDPVDLARELTDAYAHRRIISELPTLSDASFDVRAAYAVEAELTRLRRAAGHTTVGRKVGFANKALWRVLKLDTLVWAPMYDDTVRHAARDVSTLPVGRMVSPKIEPEIVFKLRRPLTGGDPAAVLDAVDWLALGFEVIDCIYADWKFQPADFIAAFGLHAALVVGEPQPVQPAHVTTLVEQLATFTVKLLKDDQPAAEGSGRNVLRSPALCLGELARACAAAGEPLAAGELISTGTLTESQPMTAGQTWTTRVSGLDVPELSVRTVA